MSIRVCRVGRSRLWQSRLTGKRQRFGQPRCHRELCATCEGSPKKSAPPISPAWIHPGLVTGGARSRNHKKSRLRCDTRRAHLLDRTSMYAELKIGNRFHRVALPEIEVNPLQELLLISYGHPHCWDVLYAVQGIQKLIPT